MKKFLLTIVVFCVYSVTFAGSLAVCPQAITCNYNKGICLNVNEWHVNGYNADQPFSGFKTIPLSDIFAAPEHLAPSTQYTIGCYYQYTKDSSTIVLQKKVNKLVGVNWTFSGWGKYAAQCSSIANPETCAGG